MPRATETYAINQFVGTRFASRVVNPKQAPSQITQFGHRKVIVKVRLLWQKTDQLASGLAGDLVAQNMGSAPARLNQPHQGANRCGFSSAVWT